MDEGVKGMVDEARQKFAKGQKLVYGAVADLCAIIRDDPDGFHEGIKSYVNEAGFSIEMLRPEEVFGLLCEAFTWPVEYWQYVGNATARQKDLGETLGNMNRRFGRTSPQYMNAARRLSDFRWFSTWSLHEEGRKLIEAADAGKAVDGEEVARARVLMANGG